MQNDRSTHLDEAGLPSLPSGGNAWTRFWFTPIPPTGLHCLRVLSGLLFCFWLLSFLGHQSAFFSMHGWFDREAILEVQTKQMITPAPLGWSVLYLAGDSREAFQAMYWGALAVLALFTLGVATRVTGVLTWVIIVSFLANPATSYEGDYLLGILAFYLMIAYLLLGQWNGNLSTAERILGARADFVLARWIWPTASRAPSLSYTANFVLRMLQIHMAIILVASGTHKLQMVDWWAGVALWYPLHPPLHTTTETLQRELPNVASNLFFLSLLQYLVLGWQIGFPFFAWRTGWIGRGLLLGGATVFWLADSLLFKAPLFGPFVMLGCLSFLTPEEWASLLTKMPTLRGDAVAGKSAPDVKKVALSAAKENIKK